MPAPIQTSITNKEYDKMVKHRSPSSKWLANSALAFVFGGLVCTLGEVFVHLYEGAGLTPEQVKSAVPVTMILLAAAATGLRVYDKFASAAHAGSLVPITGFANSIVAPAVEFKAEGQVGGIGVKMFSIAGPVLVFGTVASVIYGLVLWIFRLM